MSKYIAAYGTLRKNFYNFKRFDLEFLKTTIIEGYQLYDLGPYPCAVFTGNPEHKLTIDIIKPQQERVANNIEMMEIGAGYYVKEIIVDGTKCVIYLFEKPTGKLIESGDYNHAKNNDNEED